MYSKVIATAAVVLASSSLVSAQTHSLCNPTKGDKCPDNPAFGDKGASCDFTKGPCDVFEAAAGTTVTEYASPKGALFRIEKLGQAPTFTSKQYLFFGELEVKVQAAKGAGIVTSVVLQSDDLDEIDWEWVGNDFAQVQTNFFSKGDTTTYDRGKYHPRANSMTEVHTYTLKWGPGKLDWLIDGNVVRTLLKDNPSGYPQTPCQVKIGSWIAGGPDSPEGTANWAGGRTKFEEAPFDGYYQSVKIVDYCGGDAPCSKGATAYKWKEGTKGEASSIEIKSGGSTDSSSSSSASQSSTSSASSSSETNSATTTESGSTTKPTSGAGIGFVGTNSTINGTTSAGSPSPSPSPTGTNRPASAGIRSAANVVAVVAGGLLAAYFAL